MEESADGRWPARMRVPETRLKSQAIWVRAQPLTTRSVSSRWTTPTRTGATIECSCGQSDKDVSRQSSNVRSIRVGPRARADEIRNRLRACQCGTKVQDSRVLSGPGWCSEVVAA